MHLRIAGDAASAVDMWIGADPEPTVNAAAITSTTNFRNPPNPEGSVLTGLQADGQWYTAGIESFISTMETSSLMGSNVARLVVDKWEAEKAKVEGARIEAEKEAAEKVAAAEKAAAEEVEPDQPKEAVNEEL